MCNVQYVPSPERCRFSIAHGSWLMAHGSFRASGSGVPWAKDMVDHNHPGSLAWHPAVPIDDSDMGCDCQPAKCPIGAPWTRQIRRIDIAEADAITDNGQETWNLLAERGIDNVILCGVHLNMCVLGRPFAIRQMIKLGKNVALMRDLTDTMYNPERPPGVGHFQGTDLV